MSKTDTVIIMNWYEETIEEPLRDLVSILRNHGFNTTSSCGHGMVVEMEFYLDKDITRLYDLLQEHGYHHFRITTSWEVRKTFAFGQRSMRLEFVVDKDGEYDHGLEPLKGG